MDPGRQELLVRSTTGRIMNEYKQSQILHLKQQTYWPFDWTKKIRVEEKGYEGYDVTKGEHSDGTLLHHECRGADTNTRAKDSQNGLKTKPSLT